jgi:dGTPase
MLKAVAATYVMLRPGAEAIYEQQREILAEVFTALWARGEDALEPWLRPRWQAAGDDCGRTRIIADQIASLTDVSLTRWHGELSGA